jgi:hypothetical protein
MSQTKVERNKAQVPTEVAGTATLLDGKSADMNKNLKGHLPLIKCECGAEILLLPDLQAMNRAIKTHASKHSKKERPPNRNSHTLDKISKLLSQLSLKKIIE